MAHRSAHLRRLFGPTALAAAVVVAGIAVGTVPAAAAPSPQTRYVAVDGSDGGDTGNDCLDQANPCQHIGYAGFVASPGDTVKVGAGTFNESVAISQTLTIAGAGAGKTTIKGPEGVAFIIGQPGGPGAVPSATIKDVTVTTELGDSGSPNVGAVSLGANLTIEDSVFSGNTGGGLLILPGLATGSATVSGSTFRGNGGGILQGSGSLRVTGSTFSDNTPADGQSGGLFGLPVGIGVGFLGGTTLTVDHSSVSGSALGVAAIPEYNIEDGDNATATPTASITASTFSGNQLAGIASFGTDTTIDNSTISGNSFSGILAEQGPPPFGQEGPGGTVTVKNSTVADTKLLPTSELPGGEENAPPVAQAAIAEYSESDIAPESRSRTTAKTAPGSWLTRLMPDLSHLSKTDFSALAPKPESTPETSAPATTAPSTTKPTAPETDPTTTAPAPTTAGPTGPATSDPTATEPPATGLPTDAAVATVAPAGFHPADAKMVVLPMADEAPAAVDSSVTLSGTVVTGTDPEVADCTGPVNDEGYNLSFAPGDENSCGFATARHDSVNASPKLGALAANGGVTETQVPGAGSPAIDAIPVGEAGCTEGATDQRGTARPQGDACDIGAVEVKAVATTPATTGPATTSAPASTTAAPGGSAATDAGSGPLVRTGATSGPAIPVGIGALLLGGLLVGATALNRRRNAAKH